MYTNALKLMILFFFFYVFHSENVLVYVALFVVIFFFFFLTIVNHGLKEEYFNSKYTFNQLIKTTYLMCSIRRTRFVITCYEIMNLKSYKYKEPLPTYIFFLSYPYRMLDLKQDEIDSMIIFN